jgi:hypothetical protein
MFGWIPPPAAAAGGIPQNAQGGGLPLPPPDLGGQPAKPVRSYTMPPMGPPGNALAGRGMAGPPPPNPMLQQQQRQLPMMRGNPAFDRERLAQLMQSRLGGHR